MRVLVTGAATLDLPLRVLNLLEMQGTVVDRFVAERRGDMYYIRIDASALANGREPLVVEKLRAMVLVTDVLLEAGR